MFFGKRIRSFFASFRPSRVVLASLGIAALGFGGCAQSPPQLAASHHPKEYFPASVYGPASRRVIADGEPIPRGGGQYLVGKPYTVAGQTYYPSERKITQVGYASWYGDAFHGRLTANGEIYDRDGLTAAHPTMPLPSYARVTNLRNNYSMIVRVNDRGPYASNRIMDVSRHVAEALEFQRGGTARIKVEYVGRASLAGSDDAKLYATLRKDGPARPWGMGDETMIASAARPERVASLAPAEIDPVPHPSRAVEEQRAIELEASRAARLRPASLSRETTGSLARRSERDASPRPAGRPLPASAPGHRLAQTGSFQRVAQGRDPSSTPARVATTGHNHPSASAARTFALREPPPRPVGRSSAVSRPADVARRFGRDGGGMLPPPRPVRIAAVSASVHHGATSSRPNRSRVD